jgi:hypothetical protein
MLMSMGESTQKIKNGLFALGAASFIGMLGANQQANKLMAVPSVQDNYLNAPVTAFYPNPNQKFFRFLGFGLMAISSSSFCAACWIAANQKKQGLPEESLPQQPVLSMVPPQVPPQVPSQDFSDTEDVWADPWDDPELESQSPAVPSFMDDRDWTFQTQESNLEHPALNHKNWVDELAILVFGEQGSGKTSKLLWLAEQHLKRGDIVLVLSDMAYPGWLKGIEVAGINADFNGISQALNAFCNEGEARKRFRGLHGDTGYFPHDLPTVVLIADEVTSWSEQPALEMAIFRLAKLVLSDLRQMNLRVILGGHGNTLKTLFGKALEGKKQTFDNQFVQLQCKSKPDPNVEDGKKCAGEVIVNYYQGKNPVSTPMKIPALMPSKDCLKTMKYQTAKGTKGKKIVYDFSKYKATPFSQYHKEENQERLKLQKEA